MIRPSAGSPPIHPTQPKSSPNDSYFSVIPGKQDAESSETSKETYAIPAEFISPYPTPSERIAYVFAGDFEASIQALLEESKEDDKTPGDEAEAINYYKNWLALKELVECMNSCTNQAKLLILGVVSSRLGTYLVPPRLPISGATWVILGSLSLTVLLHLNAKFWHLTKKKEDAESKITDFETTYEFVTERSVGVANDWHEASRLETRIAPRRPSFTPPNSPSTPNFANHKNLIF